MNYFLCTFSIINILLSAWLLPTVYAADNHNKRLTLSEYNQIHSLLYTGFTPFSSANEQTNKLVSLDEYSRHFAQNVLGKDWVKVDLDSTTTYQPKPNINGEEEEDTWLPIEEELVVKPEPHVSTSRSLTGALECEVKFYGEILPIQFYKDIIYSLEGLDATNYPNKIKKAWWQLLGKSEKDIKNYNHVLKQLKAYSEQYELSEWAYTLLIYKTAQQLFQSKNERIVFTCFMLNHSDLKARIGAHDGNLYLLIASKPEIFNTSKVNLDETKSYYLYDFEGKNLSDICSVSTYGTPFERAIKSIETFRTLPKISTETEQKFLFFKYKEKYTIPVAINRHMLDYYKDVPITSLEQYSVAPSIGQDNPMMNELKKIIQKEQQQENQINILLAFVQNAFGYQKDQRPFFPEETLYHKSSDCEDRSALFAYLVKELLNTKVIGLDYSKHVATAVKYRGKKTAQQLKSTGYSVYLYDEKPYIICDPTDPSKTFGKLAEKYKNKQPEPILY